MLLKRNKILNLWDISKKMWLLFYKDEYIIFTKTLNNLPFNCVDYHNIWTVFDEILFQIGDSI